MTRVLLTGGTGQVAQELAALLSDPYLVGRPGFDFDHPETIEAAFLAARPALVINAAAYTAVDAAEGAVGPAWRANRDGPARLAALCADAGVPMIHISTDYVFDGAKGAAYVETDPTNPTGVYGASKLAGERAVLERCPRAIILRTSWVYAARGKNFLLTMLNARKRTDTLRVVADQRGTPTAATDLAAAIAAIAARLAEDWRESYAGIYHATAQGETTWHGFASEIFAQAARHGLTPPTITPIATSDWPTPARRPADSRLDCAKLAATFGLRLPPWQEGVARTVDAVLAA